MKLIYKLTLLLLLFSGTVSAQFLQLTAPNGGEQWQSAKVYDITWKYLNVDNVKIEYSLDKGLTWKLIVASYPSDALKYSWTVPGIGSDKAMVRITNILTATQDESDACFTIPAPSLSLTFPAGGESFVAGTGHYITWNESNGVNNVKLEYSTDNGTSWSLITASTSGSSCYHPWQVPSTVSDKVKIKATNVENAALYSVSTAFAVVKANVPSPRKYCGGSYDGYAMSSTAKDNLTVLSANGGELWTPATTQKITWITTDVDNVAIDYSIDNGKSWTNIVSTYPASALSYDWIIPNTPSTECLVKVRSLDGKTKDSSDKVFTINTSYVALTFPNGGETFATNTGNYITWVSNGVANVKLEYSLDSGATWTTIIASTAASAGYHPWLLPSSVSTKALVRVSDVLVAKINDVSDADFTINRRLSETPAKFRGGSYDGYAMASSVRDSIRVVLPNGGEKLVGAQTYSIKWACNNVDNLKIEYSADNGDSWTTIAASVPSSQMSYNWTVPSIWSVNYKVRVSSISKSLSDESDNTFEVVNSSIKLTFPNGGESFNAKTGHYITWESFGIQNVKLEYTIDNGVSWNLITASTTASSQYQPWQLPAKLSTQARIRISDVSNAAMRDSSDKTFAVVALPASNPKKYHGGSYDGHAMSSYRSVNISVRKPNGWEIWANNTTKDITWTHLNMDNKVKIEYSLDNEQTWTILTPKVATDPSVYHWNIAITPSTICKVRVTDTTGQIFDKSDDFFTIANQSGITTEALTGTWCAGSSVNVAFTLSQAFNANNKFYAQLSDSLGSFDGPADTIGVLSGAAAGTISAVIPKTAAGSSKYRIRVISTSPSAIGTDNGKDLTVNPLPYSKINSGRDTLLCADASLVLSTGKATSYLWSTGANTRSITTTSDGTYLVTATNACGSSSSSIKVYRRAKPMVELGDNQIVCPNVPVSINAGNEGANYIWSTGQTTKQIQVLGAGEYAVTVSNSCGSSSDKLLLTAKALPSVNLGRDTGYCAAFSKVLDAGNTGASYLWSTGATSSSITVTQNGIYSVEVKNECGVTSDDIKIATPSLNVYAGINPEICPGDTVTTTAIGGKTYIWSSGATGATVKLAPTVSTTYIVSATDGNCVGTDKFIVSVKSAPKAIVSKDATIVKGAGVTVSASGGVGYKWNTSETTSEILVKPLKTSSYIVTVTGKNSCTAIDTVLVTVRDSVKISVSKDQKICSGQSVNLAASGATSYKWSTGALTSSIDVSPQSFTKYSVTATDGYSSDSAAIVVMVNPVDTADKSVTICNGESYTFFGKSITTAGVYTKTLQALSGCDSIVRLTLIVKPVYTQKASKSVAYGQTYQFGTQLLDKTGTFTEVFKTKAGCDSTVTLSFTVEAAPHKTVSLDSAQTACGSYVWRGKTYTESVVARDTVKHIDIDTVTVMTLTINTVYTQKASKSVAYGQTYQFGTQLLDKTGTFTEVFKTKAGCDSTVTLSFTVEAAPHKTVSLDSAQTACGSYVWRGKTYTESVVARDTVKHSDIDTVTVMTLTINTVYTQKASKSVAYGQTYQFGKQLLDKSGTFTEVFTSKAGCDSTVTLSFTVEAAPHKTVSLDSAQTACGSYVWRGKTYTKSVVARDTVKHSDIDTVTVMTLTINTVYTQKASKSVAYGQTYQFGKQLLDKSGTFTEVFTSKAGCDSTVTLSFTVEAADHKTISLDSAQTACGSYVWRGKTYTKSAIVRDTVKHVDIDTVTIMLLTVNPTYSIKIDKTVEYGQTYQLGKQLLSQSGIYTEVFASKDGCDSTVTMSFEVKPLVHRIVSLEISKTECGSYTWHGKTYKKTAIIRDTVKHTDIDTVTTLLLTINEVYNTTKDAWLYKGDSLLVHKTYRKQAGSYVYIYTSVLGCDSTVTINLSVRIAGDSNLNGSIDNGEICGDVNKNGRIDANELIGDANGDGHISDTEVLGDRNGNGVLDADEITTVDEVASIGFSVSPVPVLNVLTVRMSGALSGVINIITSDGKCVITKTFVMESTLCIDLSDLTANHYVVELITDTHTRHISIVKL